MKINQINIFAHLLMCLITLEHVQASAFEINRRKHEKATSFLKELKEKNRMKRQIFEDEFIPENVIPMSRHVTEEIPEIIVEESIDFDNMKCGSCKVRRVRATISIPSCVPRRVSIPTCQGLCETFEVRIELLGVNHILKILQKIFENPNV